jgi:hypothetical protein
VTVSAPAFPRPWRLPAMSAMLARQHVVTPPGTWPPVKAGRASPASPLPGPQTADDLVIGLALTTRWMLITGRRLGQWPLLHVLSGAELIEFWADDHVGNSETAPSAGAASQPTAPSPHQSACGFRTARPQPAVLSSGTANSCATPEPGMACTTPLPSPGPPHADPVMQRALAASLPALMSTPARQCR